MKNALHLEPLDRDWSKDLHRAIARGWLENLAAGPDGSRPDLVFAAIRTMLEEALGDRHPWLDGDLAIELRRTPAGTTCLRASDAVVGEAFSVPFPTLVFDHVFHLAEAQPQLLAPGFLLADRDHVSVSTLQTLWDDELAPEAEPPSGRTTSTSGVVRRADLMGVDPEATIIVAPDADLLLATLAPEGGRFAVG